MIAANNPSLRSWISVPEGSDFPIQNLPFGVFTTSGSTARVGTRIGDTVIDLSILAASGQLEVAASVTVSLRSGRSKRSSAAFVSGVCARRLRW